MQAENRTGRIHARVRHLRIRAICSGLIGLSGKSLSPSVSDSSSIPYFSSSESFCPRSAELGSALVYSRMGKQQQKNLIREFDLLPRYSGMLRTCLRDGRTRPPESEGISNAFRSSGALVRGLRQMLRCGCRGRPLLSKRGRRADRVIEMMTN